MAETQTLSIEHGIEWFSITLSDGRVETDCQCARCGSSCGWRDCGNCNDGEREHEPWDGFGAPYFTRCDWCDGHGVHWHCISSPEWCEAHPLPGREHISSSAMRNEAWDD